MPSGDSILDLVCRIHEAGFDGALWPQVMSALTEAVGGSMSSILVHDPQQQIAMSGLDPRLPVDAFATYREDWADIDDIALATARFGPMSVVPSQLALPPERARRSAVWNDFYLPRDFGHFLAGIPAPAPDGSRSMVVVYRSRKQAPFDDACSALMQQVLPHVATAVRIHRELGGALARHRAAESALHALRTALLLTDRDGAVCFRNQAADEILGKRDGLAVSAGLLHCLTASESSQLRLLIGRAARVAAGAAVDLGATAMEVSRPSGRRPYLLAAAPLTAALPVATTGVATVLLRVLDPESATVDAVALIRSVYGLTAAEARLAVFLCTGKGPEAIAAEEGVTIGTLRMRLKRVLAKTDTHRQAELVSVLLRGPLSLLR